MSSGAGRSGLSSGIDSGEAMESHYSGEQGWVMASGGDIAAPPAEGVNAIRTLLAKSSRNAHETVPFNDRRVARDRSVKLHQGAR